MNRHRIVLLLIGVGWPAAMIASLPNDTPAAGFYARALAGDQQAVLDCIAELEKILAVSPNDQLARVYLGSAYTLRSRDLGLGRAKLDALRKGIALMDEAASAAPRDARVQLARAVTNEALPVFLGRREIARVQLNDLLAMVENGSAKLNPADKQLLYLHAGEAARRAGDKTRAAELWRRGAAIKADAKLTEEITAALASP